MGLFSNKNQVGLYIDSETISVVNGQVTGSALNVIGFCEMRVPTFLEAGPEAKQKTLEDVRTALNRAGVKSKSVLIAVPGDGSMTRHFELPVLPKKEERGAIRFEAQKYVPFDAKALYYDYETYLDKTRNRNRVVYFACKKQWVDSLSALLTLSGAKIAQVELVSQSVARAFHKHAAKKKDEVALLIVCNDKNTAEFVIQKQGSVLTTRHISLTRVAGSEELDLPMFASEVRISLDYFSENFSALKVERIFLVTPFAGETKAICDTLQRELSLATDSGLLFQPPTAALSTTAAVAAYGLTLEALEKKSGRRISLKPTEATSTAPIVTWEEEKKQLQDLATQVILALAVVFALLFFVLGGAANKKNQELQGAIESYPKAKTASLSENLADLQNKQAQAAQKMAFFNTLKDKRVYFTTKMIEMSKSVPPNVRLAKWNYSDMLDAQGSSGVVMRIEGYVLSSEAGGGDLTTVNKLSAQLTRNKAFMEGLSDIRINRTDKANLDGQAVTRFTLDCSSKKV